ncbi:MAG: hypothetical protein LBC74_09815 [Planctomycetaceae bacterium]|jgi:hypothetical protein|nr:hypothetical protein [Planctomycetaceae bacterium]
MLPKNCGQLLFNAVRETLETMAFAEVIPCSIKVGGEEFSQVDDDFSIRDTSATTDNDSYGNIGGGSSGVFSGEAHDMPDNWGGASGNGTVQSTDSWGSPDNGTALSKPLSCGSFSDTNKVNYGVVEVDSGTCSSAVGGSAVSGWDDIDAEQSSKPAGGEWAPVNTVAPSRDPWGDSEAVATAPVAAMALKEADFDEMAKQFAPEEWCWACMKVNSPDIHSVWFIVTKSLAYVLARNMYAGEEFQLDSQLIRDLIAELTNVLGGKLMLLLEEMGGKFTLMVPEIGFGLPELPEEGYENAVCKVVVDGEHPVIVALCFNPGGISATGNN